MNLNDLRENKRGKLAIKVLRENYGMRLDFGKLNHKEVAKMLNKVRGLINETRATSRIHASHQNPEYLKLLMMEQALSDKLRELRYRARIIVENEEVQKSQVILAAQDMIDSVQKMLEQISKMNVEELPAVVDGISNEIGSNESEQFNQSVGTALNTLQQALSTAKQEVQGALSTITGGAPAMGAGGELGGMEAPAGEMPEMPMGGAEAGGEELPELPELPEEPEEEEPANIGRERR